MNLMTLWPYAVTHGLAMAFVWAVLRVHHRNRLDAVKARHNRSQQAASNLIHEAKRQLAQLNKDLAAARLATKLATQTRAAAPRVPMPMPVPATAKRPEAAAPPPQLPVDGFADTLPSLQFSPETNFGFH